MNEIELIAKIKETVRTIFASADAAHDYEHIERVFNTCLLLAKNKDCNILVIKLAALLHDVDDYKIKDNLSTNLTAKKILENNNVDNDIILKILDVIVSVSFSKGKEAKTLESQIVQDADRLDAIGAIGIARAFSYGGKINNPIYNNNNDKTSISHFYSKLLKIQNLINTDEAKILAIKRTEFLKAYLDEFYDEINLIK